MKFFLDTAKVEDIKKSKRYGSHLRCDHESVPDRKKKEGILTR